LRSFDLRTLRTDRREVVADTATTTHRLGGFGQRAVDAGTAIDEFDNRIAHRLHETVDQRRGERRAGGGIDAASGDEAVFLRPQETFFPLRALLLFFVGGERLGDAAAHVVNVGFRPFGVLFDEHLGRDFLLGQRGNGRKFGDCGQGELLGVLTHGFLSGLVVSAKCGLDAARILRVLAARESAL